jgi:RimJ/RimL family protein N-acetyltransferase
MTSDSCVWQGKLVRLRAFEASDWEVYFAWDQDDEQARRLYTIPFPQSPTAVREWAEREASRTRDGDEFRFVIENQAGEVVGDLTTNRCDPRVGSFSYGIAIRREHRRRGYATDAIALVLHYYFHELRYQKATVSVYSFNTESARLHEKLGFTLEGRIRRMIYTDGEHFDELVYGITVEEFFGVLGSS